MNGGTKKTKEIAAMSAGISENASFVIKSHKTIIVVKTSKEGQSIVATNMLLFAKSFATKNLSFSFFVRNTI